MGDGTGTLLSEELDFFADWERGFNLNSPEDDFPVFKLESDGASASGVFLETLPTDSPDLPEEPDSLPLPREPLKFRRSLAILSFCLAASLSEVGIWGELLSVMFLYKVLKSAKVRRLTLLRSHSRTASVAENSVEKNSILQILACQ